MAKDLEYRLVIKDDGTAVLKKVEETVSSMGNKSEKVITQLNDKTKEIPKRFKDIDKEASNFERTMERLQRTAVAFIGMMVIQKIGSGFTSLVKQGIEYNSTLESSKLGIAAIITAQGTLSDSSGRVLQGIEALNVAQTMSSKISNQLQMDNLRTSATYEQLVRAFQQTLAPSLAVGLSLEQTRQYTLAMVQAASALNINLDMMAEETRSLLKGTITPRNTLIATALGIGNEDIKKYKGNAQELFNFIMGRLQAFGAAGEAAQMTWSGIVSNTGDAIQRVLGQGFTPFFNYLKGEMLKVQNYLITFKENGDVIINPNVVNVIEGIGTGLKGLVETGKAVGTIFSTITDLLTKFKQEAIAVGSAILAMNLAYAITNINTLISATKNLIIVMEILGYRALTLVASKFGAIGIAIGVIIYGYEKLNKPEAINAQIQRLEELRKQAVKSGQGLADIDFQLEQLRKKQTGNNPFNAPENGGAFNTSEPTFKPRDIGEVDDALAKGEKWINIQRDLTAEMNKTNIESTKWDDKLIDINKKYEEVLSKATGKNAIPVDTKWLKNTWLPTMLANLEEERSKELQKMIDEGNAAEAKLQNDIVNLHLKSAHEIFNIEKSNQINIDKLKAERGEISSLDVLKQERDLQLENLNYEKQTIDNQITYLSNQAGQMLNAKEGIELDSKRKRVEEEINAVKKYAIENISTKERESQIKTYELLKETYNAIPGMAEQAYSMELLLLNEKIKKLLMIEGIEANAVNLYKQKELNRLVNEKDVVGYDYEKGYEAQGRIFIEQMKTTGKYGSEAFLAFNDTIKGSFSSLFSDIKNHSVKPFGEYLSDFFGNLGDKFADMCSEMLTNWILTGNAMKASGMGSSSSGGLLGLIGSLFGSGGNAGYDYTNMGGSLVNDIGAYGAKGLVFSASNIVPMAKGGIITRPTLIPMANGAALTGEAGYEAAMPLVRTSSGRLGVESEGSNTGGNTIIINNITANDAKSFDDMCKRNGASITTRVVADLQGNRALKNLIKRTTR